MSLEIGSFINDLTPTNPLSSDPAGQGDDHLRLIKTCVQGTLPNMGAVFGQVRRQDTALSISSTWNTNHFIVSASATATVVLTLPPAASITTGFFVDITTIGTGTVNLAASGAGSINGAATLSIPRLSSARAYFVTGTGWLADVVPHAQGGTAVMPNLAVDGTLSVSGATVLAELTVNGVCTLSAAVHMKSTLSVSGACVLGPLTVNGTVTISGTVNLLTGQMRFPVSQNASADANTLDDYEEGTFTPTITFSTPGDLNVVYSVRIGQYTKIGDLVNVSIRVITTTFTWSTSSSTLSISGLPFGLVSLANNLVAGAIGFFQGITLLGGDSTVGVFGINNTTVLAFNNTNYNTGAQANVTTAAVPSGVQKDFAITIAYKAI